MHVQALVCWYVLHLMCSSENILTLEVHVVLHFFQSEALQVP